MCLSKKRPRNTLPDRARGKWRRWRGGSERRGPLLSALTPVSRPYFRTMLRTPRRNRAACPAFPCGCSSPDGTRGRRHRRSGPRAPGIPRSALAPVHARVRTCSCVLGSNVWVVLYEVPDDLIDREKATPWLGYDGRQQRQQGSSYLSVHIQGKFQQITPADAGIVSRYLSISFASKVRLRFSCQD